jgi:hypothetical protein
MPKKGQTWTPEQRAKILAAKQQRKGVTEDLTPEVAQEPLPPRQRVQYETRVVKPSGSRWTMKAGKWDTNAADDGADDGNQLNIPQDLHPEGITLQWVTHSIYGKEEPQRRAKFMQAGWLPVHATDFDGAFDGMFAPRGGDEEIQRDGLVLMAKPSELVRKSKDKERRDARQQVAIKEQALYGGEIDAMGADHPSAKRFNHVNRSVERVVIPEE